MQEKVSNSASSELLSIVREKLLEIEEKCAVPRRRFAREVLQVSDKTYYNICVGTATLDLKMLDRMASNLGVSVRVLVDAAPMPADFDWPAVSRRRRQQSRRVGFETRRDAHSISGTRERDDKLPIGVGYRGGEQEIRAAKGPRAEA